MLDLKKDGDTYTLTFTKEDMSEDFLNRLLTYVKIENILKDSQMTEEEAWEISEEIKRNWWKNNQDWILEKVRKNPVESNR